jgi:hypothetical protein
MAPTVSLLPGDNRESLRRLIDGGVRVHSVVTDPPYGLVSVVKRFGGKDAAPAKHGTDGAFARASRGFMGQVWDGTGIERDPEFWKLIYDILLPGGFVFAFSGSRTGHWQACAMETAGFVMHPLHGWVTHQGFPKAHDAAKAIDKMLGAEGGFVPEGNPIKRLIPGADQYATGDWAKTNGRMYQPGEYQPGSPEAQAWDGWAYGTQSQKPALEPIYLGQKPFSEKTGTANILKHGVGAFNIDGCRVPTSDALGGGAYAQNPTERTQMWGDEAGKSWKRGGAGDFVQPEGRWPANLILDGSPEVVDLFPESKGQQGDVRGTEPSRTGGEGTNCYGEYGRIATAKRVETVSSAARFYHNFPPDPIICHPKAGKADRAGGKHPCLLPGEEVLTDCGYRAIDTIAVGDLVLADDGTYRRVLDRFPSPANTKVYELHVDGTNLTTTATGNHPFLVYRANRCKTPFSGGNVTWRNADEVRIGDYLLTPVVSEKGHEASQDADWWFILGLWVAEGCKLSGSNGSTYPSFTISKRRNLDLMDLLQRRFASVSAYDRAGAFQVVVFEAGLLDTYVSLAGYGAKGKFISRDILRQPRWAREAFLAGYLRGDGYLVKGRHRASTASVDLAATLPLLAASVGRRCSVYKYDMTGKDTAIEGRTIPGGIVHKMYFSDPNRISCDGFEYDLRRVKHSIERDYVGPVWNITVEGRHTFQTRVGMSHNTVKPIALMQYLIRHITPPGGTVLDPFAGSGTTGEAARREGFDCILMEAEPDYVEFLNSRFELKPQVDHYQLVGTKNTKEEKEIMDWLLSQI